MIRRIERSLSPASQKGGDGTYTCVGLVESVAERAGHNGGEGVIPNSMETFRLTYPVIVTEEDQFGFEVELQTFDAPLISPQLLYYMMKSSRAADAFSRAVGEFTDWFLGFFDPVDFMTTDPLGRRLGYTRAQGQINEIPDPFHTGDGDLEQVVIPRPLPGTYQVVLEGLGEPILASFGNNQGKQTFAQELDDGEEIETQFIVEPYPNGPGDLNGDGAIDDADRDVFQGDERYTNGLSDPADLNGDGTVDAEDLAVFDQLSQGLVDSPDADLDRNGEVGETDLLRMQGAFGACEEDAHYDAAANLFSADRCVDFRDYYLWINLEVRGKVEEQAETVRTFEGDSQRQGNGTPGGGPQPPAGDAPANQGSGTRGVH